MSARLSGHELRAEGAPFSRSYGTGRRYWARENSSGTGGTGRGLCSCGATSDVLDSGTKRKQWHRDHKAEIRREQSPANADG